MLDFVSAVAAKSEGRIENGDVNFNTQDGRRHGQISGIREKRAFNGGVAPCFKRRTSGQEDVSKKRV